MNKYIQSNKAILSIETALENKEIGVAEYVSTMQSLNSNVHTIETELVGDYNDMSMKLVNSDIKTLTLQSENEQLKAKVVRVERRAKMAKKFHNEILKKDKCIHALRVSIKTEFVSLGKNLVSTSYVRISERFPHLNLQEIIDFDKKVKENSGSIQVHAGKWRLVDRRCSNEPQGARCGGITGGGPGSFNSWDCCGPSFHTIYNGISHGLLNARTRAREATQGGDYTDRHPWSKCGSAVTFHLKEEDEKKQDIGQIKVSDVAKSIATNIGALEVAI